MKSFKRDIFCLVFVIIGMIVTWGFIYLPDNIIYKSKGTPNVYTGFFNVWGYIAVTCAVVFSIYALNSIAKHIYDYIRK